MPERPTLSDALDALQLLAGLIEEFPTVGGASRAVALSALITPVVRGAFPVAPMHAARAPTAGSGKSFLFDVAAAIAIGHPCPVMAAGRTEEETEKRLGAALLAGQPIISVDNVNGELGGDALCQIIERPIVEIRILGKSERVRIEARATTIFATGNNLVLLGDMTRRVLLCTLDPQVERPELRQFTDNPVARVLADRGRYIAAALTLVRAYVVAGRPNPAPRLASFEGWSDTVRSALIWLGEDDPCATMEAARDEDPHLQTLRLMLTALAEAGAVGEAGAIISNNARTASELIQLASDYDVIHSGEGNAHDGYEKIFKLPALHEAVTLVANRRGGIDTREFGKWLSRHKNKIAAGFRLNGISDKHGHAAKWWVVPV